MQYGRPIRMRWLLEDECRFLNHGSFGACPRVVLEAQSHWRERMERQPVRFLFADLPELLRDAAAELAEFVGARAQDLVFVENATTGVNAVLRSISLKPGDEVVTTDHVYPAVAKSLDFVCESSGARVVVARVPFPLASPEELVAAVSATLGPRTRLAIFDHISSPTALVFPVAELVALCRARGIPVLIDGAHAPGMLPLDLQRLGADYYTGNCHKWLFAPKGCAFLWAAESRHRGLHPTVISHGFGEGFLKEFDWTGTRDPSAWLSVGAAISFWREIGGEALRQHNLDLALAGANILAEAWGEVLPAPVSMFAAMVPVRAPIRREPTLPEAITINALLRKRYNIEVPVIPFANALWIRISAQAYNDLADYEELAHAVLGIGTH